MPKSENNKKKSLKAKHIAAAADLALKLKQERKIRKEFRTFFSHLSNKYARHFARTGDILARTSHRDETRDMLHHHYKDTAHKFSGQIRKRLGQPDNNEKIFDQRITYRINREADKRSEEHADLIADTTDKNMREALKRATAEAAAAGIVLTNIQKASRAKEELAEYLRERLDLISITETQGAAESGKIFEMEELIEGDAHFDGESIRESEPTKTWVAILDEHTREWHAEADGQEVPVDEPFIVKGEELMVPGDESMGASPDNICNCRCDAVYSFSQLKIDEE
jgi:hypothetical protein